MTRRDLGKDTLGGLLAYAVLCTSSIPQSKPIRVTAARQKPHRVRHVPAVSRVQPIHGTGWPGVDAGDGVSLDDMAIRVPQNAGL